MPTDPGKPVSRINSGLAESSKPRRVLMRRQGPGITDAVDRLIHTPNLGWGLIVALTFVVLCGMLAVWSREQPLVGVGRVMNETANVRVGFQLPDIEQTATERQTARLLAPRVLAADEALLRELQASIENLPKTLGAVQTLETVEAPIREQFKLDEEMLRAVQAELDEGGTGEPKPQWVERTRRFMDALRLTPIIDNATYQRTSQEAFPRFELQVGVKTAFVARDRAINAGDAAMLTDMTRAMAREAGFSGPTLDAVVNRVAVRGRATFRYDDAQTVAKQNAAAAAVPTVITERPEGQVIFRRGQVLDAANLRVYAAELDAFRERVEAWRWWLRGASVFAAVAAVTLALAGYTSLFVPRIRKNPSRIAGAGGVLALALAAACFGTVWFPGLIAGTAILPTIFVAVVFVIAYDQRVALAYGALHGLLVCIALDQPIGVFALMVTGIGVVCWTLREIRHRNSLVRMGLLTGIALAVATVLVALIDRPVIWESVKQSFFDAAIAGVGGLTVGVVTLALLPTIERMFDITTGMTLIELRDPRSPLLRQLQQRAPGTYNHSLNVASIAESAADAIGADSLLTYVGALYHDIGKMNKPDYFVENLAGGPSKHDKLSPAMSLLVIVGHVKDGMELAREFGLPRMLQHFIEAHHGTTLVEFFFDRARRRAAAEAEQIEEEGLDDLSPSMPQEIEYRYPGPKPRTKEVAIIMLADAVESATRTMSDPTPGRIDTLVRALANKRLLDGQFDDCELTLRELQTIVVSISKSVAAIYHGRITYPSTAGLSSTRTGEAPPASSGGEPEERRA